MTAGHEVAPSCKLIEPKLSQLLSFFKECSVYASLICQRLSNTREEPGARS